MKIQQMGWSCLGEARAIHCYRFLNSFSDHLVVSPFGRSVVLVSVAPGSCMPKDYTGSSIWVNRLSSYLFDSYRKLRLVL